VTPCKAGCRFKSAMIGFWLGGLALGTGGSILGACMPYRHPVAVTISVLWWGIYLACFGASVGALLGRCLDRTPALPTKRSDGADPRPRGTNNLARIRDASGGEESSRSYETFPPA
jgi:hypothetical protein